MTYFPRFDTSAGYSNLKLENITLSQPRSIIDQFNMPVAERQQERESLDPEFFEDLENLLRKTERLAEEEREDRIKINKLNQSIAQAREVLAKADVKRDVLVKKNLALKSALDDMNRRISESSEYWSKYGFDARRASDEDDDFEFVYSKLKGDDWTCKLRVKQLKIVEQDPEVFDSEALEALNEKLNRNCLNQDGVVDYKSAMIIIRKALIKHQ